MASIGLKVNRDSSGTGIAELMMKSLMPDVGDAVAVARLKSALQTDEVQRRNYEQDILYRRAMEEQVQAETQLKAAKEAERQAFITGAGRDLALLAAGMNGGGGGGGGGGEMPVPVEEGAAAPAIAATNGTPASILVPSYRPEPDIRMSTYPMDAEQEMPEVVADPRLAGVPGDLIAPPPMPSAIPGNLPPELVSPLNPATMQPLLPPALETSLPGAPTGPAPAFDDRTRMASPNMQGILDAGPQVRPQLPPAIAGLPPELSQIQMPPAIPGLPLDPGPVPGLQVQFPQPDVGREERRVVHHGREIGRAHV